MNLLMNLYRRGQKLAGVRILQITLLMMALFLYSATGFMYFEFKQNPDLSWGDAFWWTIVTMTTVGYGDFMPSTTGGRWFVGIPTMLLGIGLLGYGLSLIATKMLESQTMEARGMKKITCVGHVAICGWSTIERFQKLLRELRTDGTTANSPVVLITDEIEELPVELRANEKLFFVAGPPAREAVLEMANVANAYAVIIQANPEHGDRADDHNLKVALAVECYNPETITVAECVNPENEPYFRRANVDSVVCITRLSEQMLVQELQDPGITEVISQLTTNHFGKQLYISDAEKRYANFGLAQSSLLQEGSVLLGIRRNGENEILPPYDFVIEAEDQLILVGESRQNLAEV